MKIAVIGSGSMNTARFNIRPVNEILLIKDLIEEIRNKNSCITRNTINKSIMDDSQPKELELNISPADLKEV